MFETLRDAAKIGMGAIWLSRENIRKFTDELIEMGRVSKEEGERLFDEIGDKTLTYGEEGRSEWIARLSKEGQKAREYIFEKISSFGDIHESKQLFNCVDSRNSKR